MEKQSVHSLKFPPGVRFHPSDEELIVYYLLNKVNSKPLPVDVVGEVELYNYNPWDLPSKAPFGEDEWYFFSPRDRKYPNGARPNRSAASGYWKATGTDKPIVSSSGARIGVRKALVFYVGKPPQGVKTGWIMIEYRIPDTLIRPQRSKGSMRLDKWVLCRIKQKGNMSKNEWGTPLSPTKRMGDSSNIKNFVPVNVNYPLQTCSSYFLSKDCQLLAKLLATGDFAQSAAVSGATSQNSNSVESSLAFQCSFRQQEKLDNTNQHGNLSTPATTSLSMNNNILAVTVPSPNGTSFYDQHESQGQMLKLNLSSAIMNLQELGASTFAGRIMQ